MFKSKKEDTKLPQYDNFRTETAFERIMFEDLQNTEDSYIVSLAEDMLNGRPLVINFENTDLDEANKVVAFLSGVIYAAVGKVEQIRDKVYLFARIQEFKDGSLEKFINDYRD